MKKIFKMLAFAAISIPLMTACSGNKDASGDSAATEQTSAAAENDNSGNLDFDLEGLKKLMDKDGKDLTSDDYDFLLDQAEVVVRRTEGMTPDEVKEYRSKLTEDETGTIMIIGMGCQAAKKSGKLSESQLRRLEDLEKRTPSRK